MGPFHTFPLCLFWIHLNIMLPSLPNCSKWCLSVRFLHQEPACISLLFHYTTCPTYPINLDLITDVMFVEEYKLWSFLLVIFLLQPVLCTLFSSDILLGTQRRQKINKIFQFSLSGLSLAVPWLRWLVASMLPKHSGFNPRPIFVGFVMEECYWNRFSLSALVFHC